MRLLLSFATLAAASVVLVACTLESTTTPSPQPTKSPASTEPTEEPEEEESSSSGGSSSGGSSSGGSSSGGSSSGGSSSGGTTTCTAPSISGTKTLGDLTSTEKGKLCDYAACPFGGYGKSKSCPDGTTVKSKSSQSTCSSDPAWTKCADLAVSDFLPCNDAINAAPCDALETLTTDPACAAFKDCAF